MASYPNSISSSCSSSQAVKYDDEDTVEEMDGLGHASKDDTDDADEDEDDEEVKEGIEKEDWNNGVGGTIISMSPLNGSVIEGKRSRMGVFGDKEKDRGVDKDPSFDDDDAWDNPVGGPRVRGDRGMNFECGDMLVRLRRREAGRVTRDESDGRFELWNGLVLGWSSILLLSGVNGRL
jgi:hypothetical protein